MGHWQEQNFSPGWLPPKVRLVAVAPICGAYSSLACPIAIGEEAASQIFVQAAGPSTSWAVITVAQSHLVHTVASCDSLTLSWLWGSKKPWLYSLLLSSCPLGPFPGETQGPHHPSPPEPPFPVCPGSDPASPWLFSS